MADEDMPILAEQIRASDANIDVLIYEINEVAGFLDWLAGHDASSVLVWNVSDGIRGFRGSLIPALARLLGVPYFGNPVPAQALAQDRFKLSAVARDAGVPVPRCFLARGDQVASSRDTVFEAPRYFVKTNSYGNKVGLGSDAIVATMAGALGNAATIQARFGDDAIVQEYIGGMELRATCLLGPRGMRFSLCHVNFSDPQGNALPYYQITPTGYIGNNFFTPLESTDGFPRDEALRLYAEVGASVRNLTSALGLRDYWAMDFRVDEAGHPLLIDLNTGAFPLGDAFDLHARLEHDLEFPAALTRALHLSHAESLRSPAEQ
ncbi:MAG: hypothetical protein HQL40_06290 [Alphaproteobacteria bacterium]|nr:hypothetical protein [Alphaproteobacteria bacterium]